MCPDWESNWQHWATLIRVTLLSLILYNCWKHWVLYTTLSVLDICICICTWSPTSLSRAVSRCCLNTLSVNQPLRWTGLQVRQWLHLRCLMVVPSIHSFNTTDQVLLGASNAGLIGGGRRSPSYSLPLGLIACFLEMSCDLSPPPSNIYWGFTMCQTLF